MSVNQAIIIGHVGRDPVIGHTGDGEPVANLSIATSESWTSKSGERKERTDWHRVVVWGKSAAFVKERVTKGMKVYVNGRIRYSEYVDKNGVTKNSTEIHVMQPHGFEIMGWKKDAEKAAGDVALEGVADSDVPF